MILPEFNRKQKKKMKKSGWIILIVVAILAGIGIWWWQSSSPVQTVAENVAPEMDVVSVNVSNIDEERIDATAEIELKNPFPVDLKSSNIEYEIYIDSIKVIQDAHNEPLDIAASDSEVIEVPVEILTDPMTRVLEHFTKSGVDSADYAINVTFQLDVPIEGEREFTMDMSKRLPTFQLMDVELQDVDPNILSSDEGIDLVVKITNKNNYPLKIENGTFYLTVEDELEVSGEMQDYVNIPANGSGDVAVHARKERGSLTQSALSVLFDQEGTSFHYVFSYTMDSENEMFNNTKMETNITGTLDEITGSL